MSLLSREVMEYADSFDEAVQKFANTQLIAPGYFIIGGTKPGQVIKASPKADGMSI